MRWQEHSMKDMASMWWVKPPRKPYHGSCITWRSTRTPYSKLRLLPVAG